jgi:nicotinate-nucleotide adenylyltransferase
MIERVIAGYPFFELSTIEIERAGPSYTVDTLAVLQRQLGTESELFFLMGWDSLVEFPRWKEPTRLIGMCRLVACTRPNVSPPDLEILEASVSGITQNVILLDMPPVDISSSDIRRRVAQRLSIHGLVPDEVERYIKEEKLYQRGGNI